MTTSLGEKNEVAIKPRSEIAIASNYLRIKFHETTGSAVSITKQVDGVASTITPTLSGSPTDAIWANAGYVTPEGDNAIAISDGSWNDIVNPSATGGILILARFYYTTHLGVNSTYNHILAVGSDGAAGGYLLRINVATNTNLVLTAGASDGAHTQTQITINGLTNTVIPVCAYLDMPTRTVNMSHDGNWAAAASGVFNGALIPKVPASTFGVTVLSKHNSTVTPSGYLNDSGGNIGGRVSDILIVNDSSHGIYSVLGDVAAEHKNHLIENLWSLDGK